MLKTKIKKEEKVFPFGGSELFSILILNFSSKPVKRRNLRKNKEKKKGRKKRREEEKEKRKEKKRKKEVKKPVSQKTKAIFFPSTSYSLSVPKRPCPLA